MGQAIPKAPTSASLPRSSSVPGNLSLPESDSGWRHKALKGTAFWSEVQWAVDHRVWGYAVWDYGVDKEHVYEGFDYSYVSAGDLALMLYRLEHGGSHLM